MAFVWSCCFTCFITAVLLLGVLGRPGGPDPPIDSVVRIMKDGVLVCYGTLVHKQWAITIPDCIIEADLDEYTVVDTARRWIDAVVKDSKSNIALLSLKKRVRKSRLREFARVANEQIGVKTKWPEVQSELLLPSDAENVTAISIEVLFDNICSGQTLFNRIQGRNLCFKHSEGYNLCYILPGLPIMSYVSGGWYLTGLALAPETCVGSPVLGLDVSKYMEWIENVIQAPVPCTYTQFRCADGSCVSKSKVCDGVLDCPCGGEDEHSCGCGPRGTSFIFGFTNMDGLLQPSTPNVYLTSNSPTKVDIYGNNNISISVYVDGSLRVVLPPDDVVPTLVSSGSVSNFGIEIISNKPITVVAVQTTEKFTDLQSPIDLQDMDGSLIYPVECLSKKYILDSYDSYGSGKNDMTVVGLKQMTNVRVTTPQGFVYTAVLNRLDTLYIRSSSQLAASIVKGDKEVAVFGGNNVDRFSGGSSTGTFYEMMPPLGTLGQVYIGTPIAPRVKFNLRIIGAHYNTQVSIYNQTGDLIETLVLSKGSLIDRIFFYPAVVSLVADKGILVSQYEYHEYDLLEMGDPSYVILPAISQCESEFSFTQPIFNVLNTLVVYISDCYGTSGLLLNGHTFPEVNRRVIDIPGYGSYNVLITDISQSILEPTYNKLSHTNTDAKMCAILRGLREDDSALWRIGGLI